MRDTEERDADWHDRPRRTRPRSYVQEKFGTGLVPDSRIAIMVQRRTQCGIGCGSDEEMERREAEAPRIMDWLQLSDAWISQTQVTIVRVVRGYVSDLTAPPIIVGSIINGPNYAGNIRSMRNKLSETVAR